MWVRAAVEVPLLALSAVSREPVRQVLTELRALNQRRRCHDWPAVAIDPHNGSLSSNVDLGTERIARMNQVRYRSRLGGYVPFIHGVVDGRPRTLVGEEEVVVLHLGCKIRVESLVQLQHTGVFAAVDSRALEVADTLPVL